MTDLELFRLTHPDLYKKFCEMGKAWQDGYKKAKRSDYRGTLQELRK